MTSFTLEVPPCCFFERTVVGARHKLFAQKRMGSAEKAFMFTFYLTELTES
jgi:hypothetical protein